MIQYIIHKYIKMDIAIIDAAVTTMLKQLQKWLDIFRLSERDAKRATRPRDNVAYQAGGTPSGSANWRGIWVRWSRRSPIAASARVPGDVFAAAGRWKWFLAGCDLCALLYIIKYYFKIRNGVLSHNIVMKIQTASGLKRLSSRIGA